MSDTKFTPGNNQDEPIPVCGNMSRIGAKQSVRERSYFSR